MKCRSSNCKILWPPRSDFTSFKMLCQQLCEAKIRRSFTWRNSWQMESPCISIKICPMPQCVYSKITKPLQSTSLIGFCDASSKVYVYLRLESEVRTGRILAQNRSENHHVHLSHFSVPVLIFFPRICSGKCTENCTLSWKLRDFYQCRF